MSPMEEPTVSEMVRAIDARTLRMEQQMGTYVTKTDHDKDLQLRDIRIAALEARRTQLWTLLALPVMVGVLVYLFQEVIK